MKVRKRPVIVDAYQIKDVYFLLNAPDWVLKACSDNTIFGHFSDDKEGVRIKTLEGDMFAPFGYYLIRGVEGELYGCDPNIFKKTYEIVGRNGMNESAPKEVVEFINEKIEQDWTLGQVAEYFYYIMESKSTWSNFPYPVKWGRLNFTLFAKLWIDRLKEVTE